MMPPLRLLIAGLAVCAGGLPVHAAPETPRPAGIRPGTLSTAPDSGGATTVINKGRRAYSLPLANVTEEHQRINTLGNSFFNENWVAAPGSNKARDGLGPLFHARSCSACHLFDGRGTPMEHDAVSISLLFRISVPGANAHGGPLPDPIYGGQLASRALPGLLPEGVIGMTTTEFPVRMTDGTVRTLSRPEYHVERWNYGPPQQGFMLGPRLAPSVFGLGLLAALSEEKILLYEDPDDANGDGISGRANWVWNPVTQRKELGRFGWKANAASLKMQTAEAFSNDMGLTTSVITTENHTVLQPAAHKFPSGAGQENDGTHAEVSDLMLDSITTYLETLAPPARRNSFDLDVRQGQKIFHQLQCAGCHRPAFLTDDGDSILPELRAQVIRPYTDLLLHDMGQDLADGRPDFLASGTEWRTPPLWGLGLSGVVNGHANLLHDGRARDPEEAILWHGGEAEASRDGYRALDKSEREALLKFLQSL